MKIYLLDKNPKIVNVWKLLFKEVPNVYPVCDEFIHFMNNNDKVECVVSPANSYGLMDGGYDLAISKYCGWRLQERVQKYIIEHFYGEQPVGTSFIIDIGSGKKLIHTPTMRVPSKIKDSMVVYQCMRSCLMTAVDNDIQSIVIPAFGGKCGCLDEHAIGRMMLEGYRQVMNPPEKIDWNYAYRWKPEAE